jgi:hypothetical protein
MAGKTGLIILLLVGRAELEGAGLPRLLLATMPEAAARVAKKLIDMAVLPGAPLPYRGSALDDRCVCGAGGKLTK